MPEEDPFENKLREHYAEELRNAGKNYPVTESDLRRVRAAIAQRERKGSGQRFWLVDYIEGLAKFLRRPMVWVPASAVVAIALLLVFSRNGHETLTLACAEEQRSPNTEVLPLSGRLTIELKLGAQGNPLNLSEGNARYSGNATLVPNTTDPAQQVFNVTVSGKSAAGETVEFAGQLILKLADPTTATPTAAQIKSAVLEGELKVAGQKRRDINKVFDKP